MFQFLNSCSDFILFYLIKRKRKSKRLKLLNLRPSICQNLFIFHNFSITLVWPYIFFFVAGSFSTHTHVKTSSPSHLHGLRKLVMASSCFHSFSSFFSIVFNVLAMLFATIASTITSTTSSFSLSTTYHPLLH